MQIYGRLLKISYKNKVNERISVEHSRRENVAVVDGEAEDGSLFWTFN